MYVRQKEKIEIEERLKQEKKKLKSLNSCLAQCTEISGNMKESSAKAQLFLKKFEEELNPILNRAEELDTTLKKADQAIVDAKSKHEYLQNVKYIERKLNQKITKETVDEYYEGIEKAIVIKDFTGEESSNDYYAEVNQKIEEALLYARNQLSDIFTDIIRNPSPIIQDSDLEALKKINQIFRKMKIFNQLDLYFEIKSDNITSKIKSMVTLAKSEEGKIYKKSTHPAIEGIESLVAFLQREKQVLSKVFNEADAYDLQDRFAGLFYEELQELSETILDERKGFISNYKFFAGLDFAQELLEYGDGLRQLLDEHANIIDEITKNYEYHFKRFVRDFGEVLVKDNKKPENEEISPIVYKLIKLLSGLKDYSRILNNSGLDSEIGKSIVKAVLRILDDNKNFKSKNPLTPYYYILNNIFYMMELTKNQNLDIVLDEATRTIIIDSYERHFLEYVKLIWPKAAESLGESLQIEFEKETKLKKSSKKAIKTKLKEFNSKVGDFQKAHKSIWIVSDEHKKLLQKKIMKYIIPKYEAFFDKYTILPFSDKKSKHIKYNPDQLEDLIEKTFI